MTTVSNLRDPEGIHNFRTLAGYSLKGGGRIREGKIYRSGALEMMTESDRSWIADELRIRTILDLRHPNELALSPQGHALADRVVPLSIFPETTSQESLIAELNGLYGPGISPGRYLHYLSIGGDRLARGFSMFAEGETFPVLVHCTAGKDRTGVLLGMVMDVLGASEEDIAHEYGLSDAAVDRLIAYLRSHNREIEGTDDELRARLATPPEKMAGFLQLLREKYGSSADFFLSKGVSEAQIEGVREQLVER